MDRACSTNGRKGMHIGHRLETQKKPLGRPRRRWEVNIKMDLRDTGRNGMDWIDVAQDVCMYVRGGP
jgi:hypothetical protein